MKYAFIGGTQRGFKLFEKLLEFGHIPERIFILKEDAHEVNKYSDKLIVLAEKHDIPYKKCRRLADEDCNNLTNDNLDFIIVCGWRTIIDTQLNKNLKLGMVAAHDSLLPKYRGFAPTNWAIINGEKETGVTLFLIDDGEVDSGVMLGQKTVPILSDDYAIDVYEKVVEATIELYVTFIDNYRNNKIVLSKQDETEATYTCKRKPDDGKINWSKSSQEVYNLIRALAHPYPGAFCQLNEQTYHIRKARLGKHNDKKYAGNIPGRVIKIEREGIEVLCAKGSLYIEEWENKNRNYIGCPSEEVKSILTDLM